MLEQILMRRHLISALLLGVLLMLQTQLWLGRGSLPQVWDLRAQLQQLQADNRRSEQDNAELANEVRDLQSGLDMVEAHARQELGLVKPDEVFIQFTSPPPPAASPSAGDASPLPSPP